jgi:hypothetical protein
MQGRRDGFLTGLAVAIGLMALSNFWKPVAQHLSPESGVGFVFLGTRLHGTANLVVGPLFGALLAAYAYGVWRMRRWVVPIACGYAAYVIVNLALFMARDPQAPSPLMMLPYAVVAIGVSSGGAGYLLRNRERLG